jgi:hypothetical protein
MAVEAASAPSSASFTLPPLQIPVFQLSSQFFGTFPSKWAENKTCCQTNWFCYVFAQMPVWCEVNQFYPLIPN